MVRRFQSGRSVRQLALTATLAVVVIAQAESPLQKPKAAVRTWEDSTGIYSVEASFVDFRQGKVTLRKEDGGLLEIKVTNLSPRDRQYVVSKLKSRQPVAKARKKKVAESERRSKQKREAPALEDRRQFNLASDDKIADLASGDAELSNPLAKQTRELWGISWTDPPEALFANSAPSADDKPIMWLRVLGDLNGFM